jgi:hypothetical protein
VKRICSTRLECLETKSESDQKAFASHDALSGHQYDDDDNDNNYGDTVKLRGTPKAQDTATAKKLVVRRRRNGSRMVKILEMNQWAIRSQVLNLSSIVV